MKKILGIGIIIIALFFASMFVGSLKDTINEDEQTKEILEPIIPEISEWEIKLEIAGIASLLGVITLLVPINPGIKGMALLLEFAGAWTFWPK